MNAIGIIVLVIGVITTLIGCVSFVIAAFEEGVWWGLGVLFFPIVSPIFLILRFGDAWRPALTFVIGFAIVLLGDFLRAAAPV
jgi:Na+-translocating ferredoxin:NAD+ oxidoreductase RnfE subunit